MRLPFLFNPKLVVDWNITNGEGYHGHFGPSANTRGEKDRWIRLTHKTEDVSVIVNYDLKANKFGYSFEGTTLFDGGRSFDRRGVESSFYVHDKRSKKTQYGGYKTLEEAAVGELNRVHERAARIKAAGGMVSVPGTGYNVTQARLNEMKELLKNRKMVSLSPSGFGMGYTFSVKGFRGDSRATAEQAAFFGVNGPLYFHQTEHD